MKKKARNSILIGVILTTLSANNIFAQQKWCLRSGKIEIPMMLHERSYDATAPFDQTDNIQKIFSFVLFPTTPESYSKFDDSTVISFTWHSGIKQDINFTLDTTEKKLKNFFCAFLVDTSYGIPSDQVTWQENESVLFSYLDYFPQGDSLLIVSVSGKTCKQRLDTADIFFKRDGFQYSRNGSVQLMHEDEYNSLYLLPDTASYTCSLIFASINVHSIVTKSAVQTNLSKFSVITSFPDHSTHFFFPSSDHLQHISICDILGREVKRIEIPSGVSEYRLQRDGFMSGYYFARLGSQSAKFFIGQ